MKKYRFTFRSAPFACALLLTGLSLCVFAQSQHHSSETSPPITVAGEYFVGGGYGGLTLTLKANQTFHLENSHEGRMTNSDAWFGTYRLHQQEILLTLWQKRGRNRTRNLEESSGKATSSTMLRPLKFMVIPWGKRVYLLDNAEMLEFLQCHQLGVGTSWNSLGRLPVASWAYLAGLPSVAKGLAHLTFSLEHLLAAQARHGNNHYGCQ